MREKILNEIVEIVENKQRQDFVLLPDPDKEINTGLWKETRIGDRNNNRKW